MHLNMQGEKTRSESPLNHRAVFMGAGWQGRKFQMHCDKSENNKARKKKRQIQTLNLKSMMAVLKTLREARLCGYKCDVDFSQSESQQLVSLQTDEDNSDVTSHGSFNTSVLDYLLLL